MAGLRALCGWGAKGLAFDGDGNDGVWQRKYVIVLRAPEDVETVLVISRKECTWQTS